MSELPDFLMEANGSAPAAQPEPAPAAPAEAAPAAEAAAPEPSAPPAAEGQPRAADGKFAPKDGAPPAAPEAPAASAEAPPAPAQPAAPTEDRFAPIAALLDEREKRQAAERRAEQAEAWRREQEAARSRQPAPQAPDPETDPDGHAAWQMDQRIASRLDGALYEQRREISQQFAVQQHGAETVKTAFDWGVQRCDEDPYFNARVRASKDPVGLVVQEYQQQQLLAEMTPSEVEAFRAWKASQAAAVDAAPAAAPAPASAPAAPPPPPAAPRPSLAAAPSAAAAATAIPRDGEAAFDAMFGRP